MRRIEENKPLKMQENDDLSICPSFSTYASNGMAEIAARVSREFPEVGDSQFVGLPPPQADDGEDDSAFEFSLVRDPIVPDNRIIFDGPVFPIYKHNLTAIYGAGKEKINDDNDDVLTTIGVPLEKLFLQDREESDEVPSCSSSEVDDLETVSAGTYCVWRPNLFAASPSRCKKSKSTGSTAGSISKRWKFRDLLRRCNSDGKDSFIFLTPKNREEKTKAAEKVEISKEDVKVTGGKLVKAKAGKPSAHELFYVRNRAMKEGDRRKSYLPYRQDLVGFFANVDGLGKTFPPF